MKAQYKVYMDSKSLLNENFTEMELTLTQKRHYEKGGFIVISKEIQID